MVLYSPFSGENFAEELRKLQEALQVHCGRDKHPPIYGPSKFFQFCSLAGAANIYNFVLSCMISSCHSEERTLLNQLFFGYSQICDFFQEDNGVFLKFCNSSQSGIEAQRQLGTSVSSKVISRNRAAIAKQNFQECNDAIQEAIAKEFTILFMIDDYHNIHTIRRPRPTKWTTYVPSSSKL